MKNGYWGKALRVDLTSGNIETQEISEEILKKIYRWCRFWCLYTIYNETDENTKPLEQHSYFGLGSLQSVPITGGGKWSVGKSPLTNTFGDSSGGGDWGIELKKAGYDFLIITGKADGPVYINIENDNVEILDGKYLWGSDSYETVDKIREHHKNDKISVACIGQAGENMVFSACIVADKHSFAGRTGLGAVMGSKNLKAIAVAGNKTVPLHDENKARELIRTLNKKYLKQSKKVDLENMELRIFLYL